MNESYYGKRMDVITEHWYRCRRRAHKRREKSHEGYINYPINSFEEVFVYVYEESGIVRMSVPLHDSSRWSI